MLFLRCEAMKHRGVEYYIAQGVEVGTWKFSTSMNDKIRTLRGKSKQQAVEAVERTVLLCALPNRAASPASGSFDQASHQSFSQLLPLSVVCSSLLTFVSCHSLRWRISKSRPQRPEECNTRRRDVSLLRISEKHALLIHDATTANKMQGR